MNDEIIQIAAVQTKDDVFNRYVWPEHGYIPAKISKITGIEIHGKMFSNSVEVIYVSLQQALNELFDRFSGSILHAHNATFDAKMLVKACQNLGIDVASKGISFCDTLSMFREAFPQKESYKQEYLVCTIIGQAYNAHNAAADVCALMELYQKAPSTVKENSSYYFAVASVKQSIAVIENKKKYLPGYKFLIDDKAISEYMAAKLSSGGISVDRLQLMLLMIRGLMAIMHHSYARK